MKKFKEYLLKLFKKKKKDKIELIQVTTFDETYYYGIVNGKSMFATQDKIRALIKFEALKKFPQTIHKTIMTND